MPGMILCLFLIVNLIFFLPEGHHYHFHFNNPTFTSSNFMFCPGIFFYE